MQSVCDVEASVNSSVDCEFVVQRLRLFVTCQDGDAREYVEES